jgi:tetratricopeptide (TPR) repeat protein
VRDDLQTLTKVLEISGRAAIVLCFVAIASSSCVAQPASGKLSEAKALIDSRQLDSAEKIVVAEMMQAPRDPDLITLLAEIRLGQNRTGEALRLLNDADQVAGLTAERAMLASLGESQAGHMDRAEPPIRAAIRLDPGNATAHYFLSRLLYTDNRFDEAIEEGNKAVALAPTFVRAYENLGLCYEGRHKLEDAERFYLKAIELESTSEVKTEWPMVDLAAMLIHEGRLNEAKPFLTQAIAINPNNTAALVQLGTLLEDSGDLKGALTEFRLAIDSDKTNQQPGRAAAYYKAARICKKLGYADEAAQDFKIFDEIHSKH